MTIAPQLLIIKLFFGYALFLQSNYFQLFAFGSIIIVAILFRSFGVVVLIFVVGAVLNSHLKARDWDNFLFPWDVKSYVTLTLSCGSVFSACCFQAIAPSLFIFAVMFCITNDDLLIISLDA